MNAKVSAQGRTKAGQIFKVVGLAAALLVGSSAVFAESHGGGGGGHFSGGGHVSGGGGGGHFNGGSHFSGGAHFGGGGHVSGGAHFSAPRMSVNHAVAGAHFSATPHYYAPGHAGARVGGAYGYGHAYGYGFRGGHGYHPAWGGGYWHGGFWPAAYYGWSYPLFLGFLPAVYSTYYWSGIPYYYVNNVYYTWNAADNGYVAADPPPVADSYSDDVNAAAAAGPDADAAPAATDNAPPDVAQGATTDLGIIAYPRTGQSEQQQATDKFQCHTWAKGQAGFDPTSQSSSNASASARSAYGRAMSACLEARGYTVR
ncbi:MAG TPA: hypothetical protein VGV09_18410 [Steroidobacteraceae bacterium]|nr:hypothetical protein [Steroidobacteraceae bacterium]